MFPIIKLDIAETKFFEKSDFELIILKNKRQAFENNKIFMVTSSDPKYVMKKVLVCYNFVGDSESITYRDNAWSHIVKEFLGENIESTIISVRLLDA